MPIIERGEFQINYEITCPGGRRALLLVAGIGEQIGSVEYPEEQCQIFSEHGFTVIRMDNRDAGLSLPIAESGEISDYSLLDLADDVHAVIEELDAGPVNVVGASLGGFIARWAAIRNPDSIHTLTVVMSGSGASPDEDGPQVNASLPRLLGMSERRSREDQIEWSTANWQWLWGTKYPFPDKWVRQRVADSVDRSYRPEGVARLMKAGMLTPGLWDAQAGISCPTLVMHGAEDPIFSSEHGRAIAQKIPKATVWLDPNMGHIMHEELWVEMAQRISEMSA